MSIHSSGFEKQDDFISEDEIGLLDHNCEPNHSQNNTIFKRATIRFRNYNWDSLNKKSLVFHFVFFFTYTFLFILSYVHKIPNSSNEPILYTPAQPAIHLEAKTISVKVNQTQNIYNGPPSPELDQAWTELFINANIRVSKEELRKLGRESIQLADGSGDYLGALDIYHQLHCLKYIRHYIHQDYYTIPITNVPVKEHVNHCIEMLRQILICKADTALMTYSWLPDFPAPWPNFGIQHQCVDFEAVDRWSGDRAIDIFDDRFLRHPVFGFSYKDLKGLPHSGEGDKKADGAKN